MSELKFQAHGVGRRKNAAANVLLFLPMRDGPGDIVINGRNAVEYFQYNITYLKILERPY